MVINFKKITLWDKEIIIKAKLKAPHVILDALENEACFYYILEGHSRLFLPYRQVDIPKKEGIAFQCGNYVSRMFGEEEETYAEVLVVKFPKEILRKIYSDDLPFLFQKIKKNKKKHFQKVQQSAILSDYVKSLLFYIENPHLAIEELLVLKIKELFIILANTDGSDKIQQLLESLFCETELSFRQLIEQNYSSNLKQEELAHMCMMSLSTFKRKFKKEFGQSPHSFFLNKKLEKAQSLIKNTSLSLLEISIECGFSEYSNFSTAFKKKHSVSPRQFRDYTA